MRTITGYDSARYYESLGTRNGESADPEDTPAPCVDTLDRIEYGECDCPWEDHSGVDNEPPF